MADAVCKFCSSAVLLRLRLHDIQACGRVLAERFSTDDETLTIMLVVVSVHACGPPTVTASKNGAVMILL
jgi:hypothetical protein